MTLPQIIAPISKEEMIIPAKSEGADILYVDYKNFIKNNKFSKPKLVKYIKIAHSIEVPIYLYFGVNISDEELNPIRTMVDELSTINVDGIMVNDFSVLEIIKHKKLKQLKFNIHLDSGLNLHNIASCELFKTWKPKSINITEEIYLKNVSRIKKYTGKTICININEVVWLLNYAVQWGIDLFKVAGNYENTSQICLLISLLKELIMDVKSDKGIDNIKVEQLASLLDYTKPQKHYQTDHFTRKFKDYTGNDFEFTGNIKIFNWNTDEAKPASSENLSYNINKKSTSLRLRLSKLNHLSALEDYITNTGTNLVDIIEYGDIINPLDLSQHNYTSIINKVKQFCAKYNMKFYLTTPKTLIERDFERVVDTIKYLCFKDPQPEGIVVNNLGLWRVINNSRKLKEIKLELGYGLEIINADSVKLFDDMSYVSGINIPNYLSLDQIRSMLKNLRIKDKSVVILGPSKLDTSGLCPLNSDIAVISRLQCKAPCQKANYAVVDPYTNEMLPMVLDGFCRLHLFHSYIEDHLQSYDKFIEAGITDFIVDFTALPPEMINPLLDRYVLALSEPDQYNPIIPQVVEYETETANDASQKVVQQN